MQRKVILLSYNQVQGFSTFLLKSVTQMINKENNINQKSKSKTMNDIYIIRSVYTEQNSSLLKINSLQ